MGGRHIEVFGGPVAIGRYATLIATADRKIRFSVWSASPESGSISVGDYALISPGVRISSADSIRIGDDCMIASNVYITDSDWHDIYDRIAPGRPDPIHIADNVWLGDSAIVCKGVTIGKNSIVGAGSVVTRPIPAGVIAAGNPARVVRELDPDQVIRTRGQWFRRHPHLAAELEAWDRAVMGNNSIRQWLRYLIRPRIGD
jgi:acetyltransferase-like isoleucine patch superfamily enzyme